MSNISVLLADDHHVVRKGISALLSLDKEINIVGEAKDGHEAITMASNLIPDVIVMDITMPILNGIDAIRQIKRAVPNTKILILTMHNKEQYIRRAFAEGASGYLLKDATDGELAQAIKTVHKGNTVLSPSISNFVVKTFIENTHSETQKDSLLLLTDRERQVLCLIAEGKTNKEIAAFLSISKSTVNVHRTNIMEKLDIHEIAGLVRYSVEKGLIFIGE